MEFEITEGYSLSAQIGARADGDRVRLRIRSSTYRGSGVPPILIPRRWPTVKPWAPRWRPIYVAAAVDEIARALAEAAVAFQEALATGPGEEAEVLRLRAIGNRNVVGPRDLAYLRLLQRPSGKSSRAIVAGSRAASM